MPKTIIRVLTLAALTMGAAVFGAAPAQAAPTVADLVVSQCTDGSCSDRSELSDGDVASDYVYLESSASSSLGLRWVQVDVKPAGGDWTCLRRWDANGRPSQPVLLRWRTTIFPDADSATNCPAGSGAQWGERTVNKVYQLRVLAREDVGSDERSKTFNIDLSNAPEAPSWRSSPRVIGNRTTSPRVEVTWSTQPDEGVAEYHIVRDGPGGTVGFAVQASKPGGQGCTGGGSSITCVDDDFPSAYGGEYAYSIFAARTTSATSGSNVIRCAFGSGNCIRSNASGAVFASLEEPAPRQVTAPKPKPTPTPTPTQRRTVETPTRSLNRGSGIDYRQFYTGTYDEELPFDGRGSSNPSGPVFGGIQGDTALGANQPFSPSDRDPTPYRALAGGLVMVLVAAHMARYLRRSNA